MRSRGGSLGAKPVVVSRACRTRGSRPGSLRSAACPSTLGPRSLIARHHCPPPSFRVPAPPVAPASPARPANVSGGSTTTLDLSEVLAGYRQGPLSLGPAVPSREEPSVSGGPREPGAGAEARAAAEPREDESSDDDDEGEGAESRPHHDHDRGLSPFPEAPVASLSGDPAWSGSSSSRGRPAAVPRLRLGALTSPPQVRWWAAGGVYWEGWQARVCWEGRTMGVYGEGVWRGAPGC